MQVACLLIGVNEVACFSGPSQLFELAVSGYCIVSISGFSDETSRITHHFFLDHFLAGNGA